MRKITKTCDVCGSVFETRSKSPERERYCTKRCRAKVWNAAMYARRRPVLDLNRQCVVCGQAFVASRYQAKAQTCSPRCSSRRVDQRRRAEREAKKDLTPRKCLECGTEYVPNSRAWRTQLYCSQRCQSRVNGRKYVQRRPGVGTRALHRRKWGGAWSQAIQRDSFSCQRCGTDKRLVVHHVDGSGETEMPNHDLNNLVTLCGRCHTRLHKIVFRIIDGEMYVSGPAFEWYGVGDTVKVLKKES